MAVQMQEQSLSSQNETRDAHHENEIHAHGFTGSRQRTCLASKFGGENHPMMQKDGKDKAAK